MFTTIAVLMKELPEAHRDSLNETVGPVKAGYIKSERIPAESGAYDK
jgi:hypothetical protein